MRDRGMKTPPMLYIVAPGVFLVKTGEPYIAPPEPPNRPIGSATTRGME